MKEAFSQGSMLGRWCRALWSPYKMGVVQVPLCHLWLRSLLRTCSLVMYMGHRMSKIHTSVHSSC